MTAVDLSADCAHCSGLCCVVLPLTRSADFPIDKPAGTPCRHLQADSRCGIHGDLRALGFRGCAAFDCFGAGQRVTKYGAAADFTTVLRLHELMWYLSEAVERVPDGALRSTLAAAYDSVDALAAAPSGVDAAAQQETVAPLLRAGSAAIRQPGARTFRGDLAGVSMAGADLSDADLHGAVLIAADLHGAVLRRTDLIGADLRGADLRGADLQDALYVTRTQVGGALGDVTTRLPRRLSPPEHWAAGR